MKLEVESTSPGKNRISLFWKWLISINIYNNWRFRITNIWNSLSFEKKWKKFGSFIFLLYLCIRNTETTKTLLIEKENNKLWTQSHAQPTSLASSQSLKSKTTSTEEIWGMVEIVFTSTTAMNVGAITWQHIQYMENKWLGNLHTNTIDWKRNQKTTGFSKSMVLFKKHMSN